MAKVFSPLTLAINRMGGPSVAPVFSPDDIEQISSWWDFSSTDNVNLSGTKILGAYDMLGGSVHLVSSGGYEPVHELLGFNGLYIARFVSSTNDRMWCPNNAAHNFGSGDFSIFMVYKSDDVNRGCLIGKGNAHRYHVRANNADSDDGYIHFSVDDDTTAKLINDGSEDFTDNVLRTMCFRRDGENIRIYSNGAEVPASPTSIGSYGDLDDVSLDLFVGCSRGIEFFLDGSIGEIITYKGTITDDNVLSVSAHLINKWMPGGFDSGFDSGFSGGG